MDFVQAQIRFGPGDSVAAFRVAGDLVGGAVGAGDRQAPVIHGVAIPILKDGDIPAEGTFPRFVEAEGDPGSRRNVESERSASFEAVDEPVVGEEFESAAELDRCVGDGGGPGESEQYESKRTADHGNARGLGWAFSHSARVTVLRSWRWT